MTDGAVVEEARRFLALLPPELTFELPDGQRLGAPQAGATVVFRDEESLAALLAAPSLLGFAEAFVAGVIDIRGDLTVALEAAYAADTLVETRLERSPARPPDDEAIRFHYDFSHEFYALFLDRRMVYTCAYYARPEATLDEAQAAKLDLVCRKLRLSAGERFLDVGSGWGALTAWAAEHYRVEALGITLSRAQTAYAVAALGTAALGGRARVERRHYRDLAGEGAFDKIAAVGAIEHVGVEYYPDYFACLYRALRSGGLLLNHGITHPSPGRYSSGMTFLTRHVFPGAEFERVGHVVARMEEASFRILDVEALGGHYALTTREWLSRLQKNADRARALVGERVYRTWIGYLAAASVAFGAGWLDVHQVLAERPDPSTPRRPERRVHGENSTAV